MSESFSALFALALLIFLFVFFVKKIMNRVTIFEYERGLKYRKGKFIQVLGPGLYWQLGGTKIEKVDVRRSYETVTGQEILTSDGASVKVSLSVAYEMIDPKKAFIENKFYQLALHSILQSSVRKVIGQMNIETFLQQRDDSFKEIGRLSQEKVEELGLKLTEVSIRDIMLAGELKKAVSQVATAKQESLAKLERARGESAALRNLANTAKMIEDNPNLLKLRTLDVISQGTGNTVIVGSSEINPVIKK